MEANNNYTPLRPGEITDTLRNKCGMETKIRGDQVIVRDCAYCDSKGQPINGKADNQWKLAFRTDTGAFNCVRCKSKGSFYEFKKFMGLVVPLMLPKKQYKMPVQSIAETYPGSLAQYPEVVDYFAKRKITLDTLKKFEVGAALYQFDEFDDREGMTHSGGEELCITFPSIEMYGNQKQIIRIKARSLKDKKNMRLDPSNGMWGWFGWHLVPADAKEIVITEGEVDAMSVFQDTGIYAISLPNGSNSLPQDLLGHLNRFEAIYLWMDDDVAGRNSYRNFAERLGLNRTKMIWSRDGKVDGPKDANEALQKGQSLTKLVLGAKPELIETIKDLPSLRDAVFAKILDYEKNLGTPMLSFPKLTSILGGIRMGEFTIITGQTGTGKTTTLNQIMLDMAKQSMPVIAGSFEMSKESLARNQFYNYSGINMHKNKHMIESKWATYEQLPIYFMDYDSATSWDQVEETARYAIGTLDCKLIVLDNLQFMTFGQGKGFQKFDVADDILTQCSNLSKKLNVHIFMVIHPKKVNEGMELDISSVGGTGVGPQIAFNMIVIQKGTYYNYLDIRKNREGMKLGQVPYRFDPETYRMIELSDFEIDEAKNRGPTITAQDHGMGSQVFKASNKAESVRKPMFGVASTVAAQPYKRPEGVKNFADNIKPPYKPYGDQ